MLLTIMNVSECGSIYIAHNYVTEWHQNTMTQNTGIDLPGLNKTVSEIVLLYFSPECLVSFVIPLLKQLDIDTSSVSAPGID